MASCSVERISEIPHELANTEPLADEEPIPLLLVEIKQEPIENDDVVPASNNDVEAAAMAPIKSETTSEGDGEEITDQPRLDVHIKREMQDDDRYVSQEQVNSFLEVEVDIKNPSDESQGRHSDEADRRARVIHSRRSHTEDSDIIFNNGTYTCSVCNKTFVILGRAQTHVLTHKEIECRFCKQLFTSRLLFESHVLKQHGSSPRRANVDLTCDICQKKFYKNRSFRAHQRYHSQEKKYACDCCEMKFKGKGSLAKHMSSRHLREKPHKCEVCAKTFSQKNLLKQHLITHTGIKAYACPFCNKAFSLKYTMKKHLRTHEREKKLTCDICHKTFPLESRLKYHMITHTKEKLFSCDLCRRKFSHKHNVIRHIVCKHPHTMSEEFVMSTKCKIKDWAVQRFMKKEMEPFDLNCVDGNNDVDMMANQFPIPSALFQSNDDAFSVNNIDQGQPVQST